MKTIDPNELRPAKEWLKYLPEPLRTEALDACQKWPLEGIYPCKFSSCIANTIHWGLAQPKGKWGAISIKLYNGEILPVQLEEVKEGKPETKQPNIMEVWKSLTEKVEDMQYKIHSLQKELDERCPKKIEAKAEPEPRKLPLTIEEVYKERRSIIGMDSWFYKDNKVQKSTFVRNNVENEFRKESSAKKSKAFNTLLKIAEAQNEMREREEKIWVAWNPFEKEIKATSTTECSFGQIYFHSEQGLKDCIAANEQLFKDYIEIAN